MSTKSSCLTPGQLSAFLNGPHTARLACNDANGLPYIVPLWHQWDGHRFWVIASERAKWVDYLRARPQVALSIDDADTSRVLIQGRATIVEGPVSDGEWVPIARQMVCRYLGESAYPAYQSNTAGLKRWLIAVSADVVVSWRGPSRTD